jgi:hypothetical protein
MKPKEIENFNELKLIDSDMMLLTYLNKDE